MFGWQALHDARRRFPPMTDERIRAAVDAFVAEQAGGATDEAARRACDFRHSPAAEAEFGPVASWPVSAVTDFSRLFWYCAKMDEDISRWDVASGKRFGSMFLGASVFNQNLRGWAIPASAETYDMFRNADSFDLAAHAPRAMGLLKGKPRTKWSKEWEY